MAAEIVRIIPLDEVAARGDYDDMAELAVIFNHDIVEVGHMENQRTWRWKANKLVSHLDSGNGPFYEGSDYNQYTKCFRGSIDLNNLWMDLYKKKFSVEEMMKFYMQIGMSLCGFGEAFGQKEAYELNLPDAKRPDPDEDPDARTEYVQNILEYMLEKHKGQVLKL